MVKGPNFDEILHYLNWEVEENLASTFVGSTWSFVFFIPTTTANDLRLKGFLPQMFSITFLSYPNSWEKASISLFNVEC